MDSAFEHGDSRGSDLFYFNFLRRRFCLPRHAHEFEIQAVFKLDFHFSVHHAAVDARNGVAKRIQLERSHSRCGRTFGVSF